MEVNDAVSGVDVKEVQYCLRMLDVEYLPGKKINDKVIPLGRLETRTRVLLQTVNCHRNRHFIRVFGVLVKTNTYNIVWKLYKGIIPFPIMESEDLA